MIRSDGNGKEAAGTEGQHKGGPVTNVLVLRGGKIYFEGPAEELLHSSDDYLKMFLASAE